LRNQYAVPQSQLYRLDSGNLCDMTQVSDNPHFADR
jgi:hypothetical protein